MILWYLSGVPFILKWADFLFSDHSVKPYELVNTSYREGISILALFSGFFFWTFSFPSLRKLAQLLELEHVQFCMLCWELCLPWRPFIYLHTSPDLAEHHCTLHLDTWQLFCNSLEQCLNKENLAFSYTCHHYGVGGLGEGKCKRERFLLECATESSFCSRRLASTSSIP